MNKTAVLRFAKSKGYSKVDEAVRWKGYEVYPLSVGQEGACVGYPLVAMVKNGKIRLSTPNESLDFLQFLHPQDFQDSDV